MTCDDGWQIFYITTVTDVPSRITKFTVTCFTTQSQIIHISTVKINAAIIHLPVSLHLILD